MTSGTINDSGALTATLTAAGAAVIGVGGTFGPTTFNAGTSTVTLSGDDGCAGGDDF